MFGPGFVIQLFASFLICDQLGEEERESWLLYFNSVLVHVSVYIVTFPDYIHLLIFLHCMQFFTFKQIIAFLTVSVGVWCLLSCLHSVVSESGSALCSNVP